MSRAFPDLGSMLGQAKAALITDPHVSYPPGIMIFLIVSYTLGGITSAEYNRVSSP